MTDGSWVVVTPAYNEAARLPAVAAGLAAQTAPLVALWVVVDDGSTDGTADVVDPDSLPFPLLVLRRERDAGGLRSGSEAAAFRLGAESGLARVPEAAFVMKLDADIRLAPDYFEHFRDVPPDVGITGGRLGDRTQTHHVRGGLRGYSRRAWDIHAALPSALGWDVMDQVAVRRAGLRVVPVPEAVATTSRYTASSAGIWAGRIRTGVSSRWCGYHPLYFALRLVRSLPQRPVLVGPVAILWGWLRAGRGPWPQELREHMRGEQRERLRALARHPVRWLRSAYH